MNSLVVTVCTCLVNFHIDLRKVQLPFWSETWSSSRVWKLREFSVAEGLWLVTGSSSCCFWWSLSRGHSPVLSLLLFREQHKAKSSCVSISPIMDGMHGWEIRELCLSCCMTIHKSKVVCQDSGHVVSVSMMINYMQCPVKSILWNLWLSMNH